VENPLMAALAAAAFVAFLTLTLYELVFTIHLREHRIDLEPGEDFASGASRFVALNVYRSANYSEFGQTRLRRLYQITGLRFAVLAVWMVFSAIAFL
jgi:hypothetical protein